MPSPRLPRILTPESFALLVDAIEFGEPPRYVGQPGQPAFAGAWVNFDGAPQGTRRSVGFWKDALGMVHLEGLCKDGSGAIFTLPDGYRPLRSDAVFTCAFWDGTVVKCVVVVSSAGTVTLSQTDGGGSGAGKGPWLDGIYFRAA